jgi:hypothetical protein
MLHELGMLPVEPGKPLSAKKRNISGRRLVLGIAKGDLIASSFLALFVTGFFGLLYNISPNGGWPVLTTIGLLSFLISVYLLQNQRKNRRKWEKRPVTFPNPEGGGILGLYTERPWYSELAELGRQYKRKKPKSQEKSR